LLEKTKIAKTCKKYQIAVRKSNHKNLSSART